MHSYFKKDKGQSGELQADQSQVCTLENRELLEHISGHKREMMMTGKSKHGFTKSKSHLTNLIAYYDEMMVFVNGEQRISFTVTF